MTVDKEKLALAREYLEALEEFNLTEDEMLFVFYYFAEKNDATKAYLRLRPNVAKTTAWSSSSKLFNRPNVKSAIRQIFALRIGEAIMPLEDEIINLYKKCMRYDIADFCNADGSPKHKNIEDFPEDMRCVIKEIETKAYGKDAVEITTIKLADRIAAAKELAKYIQMTKPEEQEEKNHVVDKMLNLMDKILDKDAHDIAKYSGFRKKEEAEEKENSEPEENLPLS